MLAGHDTTASSVMWGLYELSRHPECQHRIREELSQIRLRMSERGNDTVTMADLESMRYFNAFIKVSFRVYNDTNTYLMIFFRFRRFNVSTLLFPLFNEKHLKMTFYLFRNPFKLIMVLL